MALERNPNSKNMFYVDPELFPIQGTNCTIDIEESTGKFTFDGLQKGSHFELIAEFDEPLDAGSYTFWMQHGLNEPINTAALYWNQVSIRSINYNGFDKQVEWGSDTANGYNFTISPRMNVTQLRLVFDAYSNMLPQFSGPQGIALTLASESFNEWESAYREVVTDGFLFVRFIYQNEDGTWPDFTSPYETKTYTLPAGVNPIPEEAFVPNPAKVPSTGEYVLDEGKSDTGTVTITAGSTRNAAIYFKLNFEVTYHDATGTNADVTTDSLEYGATTPTAPSWTRDGYTLSGWTPAPSATVTQDVTYTAVWKMDLDPALSSKLITVGQLARLMGKAAPPDDQKDKLVTVGQAYSVV